MTDYSTQTLSKSVSSHKVLLKEMPNGNYISKQSGKCNCILAPLIILILIGVGLYFTNAFKQISTSDGFGIVLVLVAMGAVCYFIQSFLFTPIIFDFSAKKAFVGQHDGIDISRVIAVQILTYHYKMSGSYKVRFEINLVDMDGKRTHLFNNANYHLVCEQSQLIASEINCEVWDESNG